MRTFYLLGLMILFVSNGFAQERYLTLSDFRFSGITARYQDDTTTTYSLLCKGQPKDLQKTAALTDKWLAAHKDATVRPVCSFSYYNALGNRVTFTYVWIVSNMPTDPNLNAYLVKNGACTAASMWWANSASILKPAIDFYARKKPETKVFVDKGTYRSFVLKLKAPSKQNKAALHR